MILDKYPVGFFECGRQFAVMEMRALQVEHAIVGKLSRQEFESVQATLKMMRAWCVSVGLESSVKGLDWALSLPHHEFRYKALKGIFGELRRRIEDDLDSVLLVYMPPAKAKYCEPRPQFGPIVQEKFGKATEDIEEAAKCYATSRNTATVFHLMRVMELAVQYLGDELGIDLVREKNWHNLLDEVDKAVRALPIKSSGQKAKRNRYAESSAHLRMVKDAWRNDVMHPKETYTEEEAERIFRNVKDFMVHLAAKL
jgi:HEPN domain-containing protein